LSLYPFC